MNRIFVSVLCTVAVGGSYGHAADGKQSLASKALAVFSAKCAGCHGPNLARPEGRFGYVLDLAQIAANPEMVVAPFPEESELWELVRRGEMPPEDSPTGALSSAEKEIIRAWIAAGAPPKPMTAAAANPASSPQSLTENTLPRLRPSHLVVLTLDRRAAVIRRPRRSKTRQRQRCNNLAENLNIDCCQ